MPIPKKEIIKQKSDAFLAGFPTQLSINTSYKALSDGFLILWGGRGNGDSYVYITINGVEKKFTLSTGRYQYGWVDTTFTIPIAKGSTFKWRTYPQNGMFSGEFETETTV